MPPRPTLVPTQVTLTISDDPAFVPRHGWQVLRAGGRYTDPRGHSNRLVTLPGGNDALIDAIAAGFAAGRVEIHVLRWAADGVDERLGQALDDPGHLDLHWDRSPGGSARCTARPVERARPRAAPPATGSPTSRCRGACTSVPVG